MKKQLEEINFLRPIVILLLIVYHAFAIYGGGWDRPDAVKNIRAYFWICRFSYSSMLETFVFISGYVFAFQYYGLKKNFTSKNLIVSKLRRLILPSIVFSIVYSILFYERNFFSIRYLYDIINGLGHLWFLPMLFWCFLFTFFLYKIRVKEWIKLLFLLLLSIFHVALPLQLGLTC